MLKDNEKLRTEMGQSGRHAVREQTIQHVVTDLLSWYNKGIHNNKIKPIGRYVFSYLLLVFFVPTTIFMFFVYDILVRILFLMQFFSTRN
jgi:hypothetical protein